jgi:hypothetical protein
MVATVRCGKQVSGRATRAHVAGQLRRFFWTTSPLKGLNVQLTYSPGLATLARGYITSPLRGLLWSPLGLLCVARFVPCAAFVVGVRCSVSRWAAYVVAVRGFVSRRARLCSSPLRGFGASSRVVIALRA